MVSARVDWIKLFFHNDNKDIPPFLINRPNKKDQDQHNEANFHATWWKLQRCWCNIEASSGSINSSLNASLGTSDLLFLTYLRFMYATILEVILVGVWSCFSGLIHNKRRYLEWNNWSWTPNLHATLRQSTKISMMIMKIDIGADEEPSFHWT